MFDPEPLNPSCSVYGEGGRRRPLFEARVGGKPIKIGRSSSNPGYLSIALADEKAYEAAAMVFEDMAGAAWLREQAKDGIVDSLGVFVGKESRGDAYWLGDVWWEERTSGLDLRLTDSYTDGLVVDIGPNYMRRSSLKRETHKYGKVRRVSPKTYVIRSVQAFLRGVQDGTNGKDRVYARVSRGPAKAGGPKQRENVMPRGVVMTESSTDGLAPGDWDTLNDWWFDYSGWEGDFDIGYIDDDDGNGPAYLWVLKPEERIHLRGKLAKKYAELYVAARPDISDVGFATPRSSEGREMKRLFSR